MNVPPPPPTSRPDGGNRALKILLVVLVFVGIPCIVGVFFLMNLFKKGLQVMNETLMPVASCAANIESARDAMLAYAKDHNGFLPKADRWQEEIRPYYEKEFAARGSQKVDVLGQRFELKPFPKEGAWYCETGTENNTGIAFNAKIAGAKLADVKDPRSTALLFEIEKPRLNAVEEYAPKPKSSAPKMFGESRDWMVVYVEGEGPFSSGSYSKDPRFRVEFEERKEAAPSSEK